jgi:pyruvate dehydrogenase E1 component beta subunit
VPEGDHVLPIGKAKVRREGTDVTITAHSRMVGFALQAAEQLAGEGISCEVVDLRGAAYPVEVDPFTTTAAATKSGSASSQLGWSSTSADTHHV